MRHLDQNLFVCFLLCQTDLHIDIYQMFQKQMLLHPLMDWLQLLADGHWKEFSRGTMSH